MARMESKEFDWLRDKLVGRTITDVEAGTTNGWVLLHLGKTADEEEDWPKDARVFIAICIGGPDVNVDFNLLGNAKDRHCWLASLNIQDDDGGGLGIPIRDHRAKGATK
jgi:hypothetical protein